MNETKTEQKPAPTRFQRLKMKVMKPAMAFTVAVTAMVSSASATVNFTGVVDVIDAVIPIFDSLVDLIIAVVPLIIVMAVVGGIVLLIKRVLGKSLGGGL